ncbi:MAG: TrkH family potassium uptake protein, partial [Methanobacterium sp.]
MHAISKIKIGEIRSILHYTGFMCIFLGLIMLVPILVALIYGEYKYILPFVYSAIISIFIGFIFYMIFNKEE